jgi:hypothetical protein
MFRSKSTLKNQVRSISSSRYNRLRASPTIDSNHFLYLGENPSKRTILSSKSPLRLYENPYSNPTTLKFGHYTGVLRANSSQNRLAPYSKQSKLSNFQRFTNERLGMFKRKIIKEDPLIEPTKEPVNFFINQLISVPINERKSSERIIKKKNFLPVEMPRAEVIKKEEENNEIKTIEKKAKNEKLLTLVVYCENLTLDDTESPSPQFKPKYL